MKIFQPTKQQLWNLHSKGNPVTMDITLPHRSQKRTIMVGSITPNPASKASKNNRFVYGCWQMHAGRLVFKKTFDVRPDRDNNPYHQPGIAEFSWCGCRFNNRGYTGPPLYEETGSKEGVSGSFLEDLIILSQQGLDGEISIHFSNRETAHKIYETLPSKKATNGSVNIKFPNIATFLGCYGKLKKACHSYASNEAIATSL